MNKFLLDYNLKVRLPIVIFVILSVFAITYYVSYAERNGIGNQPEQPIKYSHKLHAGDLQIDCKYCHSGVENSRVANIPSPDVCMNCHTIARKDTPEIQKLTKYYEEKRPIQWKRIHRVPEFVYFNHSAHVNKDIDCINCHGDIAKMEVVGQVNSFTMRSCLDCHRNPEKNIQDFQNLTTGVKNGPEYCSACHR